MQENVRFLITGQHLLLPLHPLRQEPLGGHAAQAEVEAVHGVGRVLSHTAAERGKYFVK